MTDPEFKLTAAEIHSAAWQRIKAHFEERLQAHRRNNDGDLDQVATARLRGRIKEILYLLEISQPEIPAPAADHDE